MKIIIFSDLDGTLLDHDTYSFEKAKHALKLIKKNKVPLVLCTSKTFAETEHYQKLLDINEPFIVEDGGGIYIPKDYFKDEFECLEKKGYLVVELGTDYKKLREALKDIKEQEELDIIGFGDMSPEEIAEDTGLTLEQAKLAAEREYDEPFKLVKGDENKLKELIEQKGLKLIKGGRYYHITGGNDKGKAVGLLTDFFRIKYEAQGVSTIGIGDSENDFAMLDKAEIAYLVQRPDESYASEKYLKAQGVGPKGWSWVVKEVVS
ncbi:HAD-IIB family hydrolase [Candidatus Woesearchaeota archaeon]|nr:HAD-IIB family hydrolase [Candidatus Woesearchaeota archaeon]